MPVSAVRAAAAESTGLHYYDEVPAGREQSGDRERELLIASIDELTPEDGVMWPRWFSRCGTGRRRSRLAVSGARTVSPGVAGDAYRGTRGGPRAARAPGPASAAHIV